MRCSSEFQTAKAGHNSTRPTIIPNQGLDFASAGWEAAAVCGWVGLRCPNESGSLSPNWGERRKRRVREVWREIGEKEEGLRRARLSRRENGRARHSDNATQLARTALVSAVTF